MAKANAIMSWKLNTEERSLACSFVDGGERVFRLASLTPECVEGAIVNGMKQRFADAAALSKGATVSEKQAAVWELMDYYESGATSWARKSLGAGGTRIDVGLVVEALCAVRTQGDVDKANALIDGIATKRNVTREEAAKLWASTSEVAPEYATRLARRRAAASPVDADTLELELMDEEVAA